MIGSVTKGLTNTLISTGASMAPKIAGALGGKEAEEKFSDNVRENLKESIPKVNEKVNETVSNIRKGMYQQLEERRKEIEPLISDPIYDKGLAIADTFDSKLPKLTQELDDDTLAKYLALLSNNDQNFNKMFKNLMDWMNNLPKPKDKKIL